MSKRSILKTKHIIYLLPDAHQYVIASFILEEVFPPVCEKEGDRSLRLCLPPFRSHCFNSSSSSYLANQESVLVSEKTFFNLKVTVLVLLSFTPELIKSNVYVCPSSSPKIGCLAYSARISGSLRELLKLIPEMETFAESSYPNQMKVYKLRIKWQLLISQLSKAREKVSRPLSSTFCFFFSIAPGLKGTERIAVPMPTAKGPHSYNSYTFSRNLINVMEAI